MVSSEKFSIFLIEMRGTKRSNTIKMQLQKLKINFEIESAIEGKKLTSSELESHVDLEACKVRLGYPISRELIGSGLSHRRIYAKALERNLDWILVLEEDVKIVNLDFFISELPNILKNEDLKKRPTLIQLFSRGTRIVSSKNWKSVGNSNLVKFLPRLAGSGAPAYLINREALNFFKSSQNLDGVPDWPPWMVNVEKFAIFPWPFYESGLNSTVPQNWTGRHTYIFRKIRILTFIYFIQHVRVYRSIINFLREEWIPLMVFLAWKILGQNCYPEKQFGENIQIMFRKSFRNNQ